MSTTIDSLQIEIQSNSSGAAAGIDSLATALGKLKANGAIGVAVRNLGKLSDALKQCSAVAGSVGTLNSLADAVNKLSGAGSFSKVITSLNKLPDALSGLQEVDIDKFASQVAKLDSALTPLARKMSAVSIGLKTVNSNAKSVGSTLGGVNSKINTTNLNFSNLVVSLQGIISTIRPIVGLLSSVIGQAIEWDGIAARFGRGFGAQADEVYNWILRLNKEMGINVQQFMQYSSTYATMLSGFGVASKDASKMALGYMELTYDIWAGYNDIYKSMDEAATAIRSAIAGEVEPVRKAGFTIIESTLEQTAANHGLSISLENATEAQKSYLRYLTLVDQAHAQGLVGAYARELNTAEGLMRTFSQQLKSLAQTFGSLFLPILVKVMPWLQAFVGLLTDAVRAVASFFGITIQEVDWGGSGGLGGLGDAADSATGSLDDTAGAVDDVTDALKDLKKATIGIDELNVISPPKENANAGGSGAGEDGLGGLGSGGLDIDSLWDESIFDSIQDQVDAIKEKFKEWLPVLGTIGGALAGLGIATLLKNLGDALSMMNTLQKVFASIAILTIEAAIVFTLADNYLETGNLLYILGEALVTAAAGYLMFRAWGAGGATLALAVSIIAQLVAIEMNLADGTISLSSPELWIQALSTAVMGALGGAIISKYTGFTTTEGFVIGLAASISLTLSAIRMGAIESGEIDSGSFESWIMEAISVASAGLTGYTIGKAVFGVSGAKAGLLIGTTAGLVINLVEVIGVKGEDFGNNFSDWLNVAITGAMGVVTAKQLWTWISASLIPALKSLVTTYIVPAITTALGGIATALGVSVGWAAAIVAAVIAAIVGALYAATHWEEVKQFFTETVPDWFSGAWDWIKGFFGTTIPQFFTETIPEWVNQIGYGLGYAIGSATRSIVDWWNESVVPFFTETIPDAMVTAGEAVKTFFSTTLPTFFTETLPTFFEELPGKMYEIGENIVTGIWDGITSAWDWLIETITGFCDSFVQGFKDAFGIHSPSTVFAEIGGFLIEGLWSGIDGLWDSIVEKITGWANGIVDAVKGAFDPNTIKDKLSEMWSTATDWWGNKPSLKEYVPSIGSIKDKVASAWDKAKGWWDKSKAKLSQYTPSIGSIKDKVSSAWSTAKTWWNKSKGTLSTYTPSIGSIKTKLSSAWSTAKTWWSRSKGSLSYTPSVGSIKDKLSSAWSSAKKWWNSHVKLSIPSLSFKVTYTTSGLGSVSKAIVKALGLKGWPKLSFAANGGIFDAGSLIWAGEAGAEIVANAGGGKTGVMNVDQMQDAVYEGVYSAVIAAMRASGGNNGEQAVNVYLDGKQITSVVERRQSERGASIMGKQVYGY